jgi:hypothetical protein
MGADLSDKRVLVLSDNEALSEALCLNLRDRLQSSGITVERAWERGGPAETGSPADLIVVAISSGVIEPIVILSRASLLRCVGEIPLLILSDRPFRSSPQEKILRLDLPYDVDELPDWVRAMLVDDDCLDVPGAGNAPSRGLLCREGMDPRLDTRG